jgi:hypothetical protein
VAETNVNIDAERNCIEGGVSLIGPGEISVESPEKDLNSTTSPINLISIFSLHDHSDGPIKQKSGQRYRPRVEIYTLIIINLKALEFFLQYVGKEMEIK